MTRAAVSDPDATSRDPSREPGRLLAVLVLVAILLAFFLPLLAGRVLYPHDNAAEVGLPPDPSAARATQRYGDMSTEYIPELREHLGGEHAGWLATWNPHNGLGLPLIHYYGLGRAFLVGHVLSWFTQDPFRTWTWLAILALSGTAVFCWLFLRELGLHPLACTAAALGISLCPFHAAWETFLQIPWGFCWTFAFLWGVERLLARATPGRWIWIVFSIHALLLTGYPQHIVWCGYLGAGWVAVRVLRAPWTGRARLGFLLGLAGAVVLGVLSVAPVYLDILVDLQRSTRAAASADIALRSLPRLESALDLRVFLLQLYDVTWMGDPLSDAYPRSESVVISHCFTPLFVAAIALAWLGNRRRAAFWTAFAAVALLLAVWPAAFRFGVRHLGLSFSLFSPLMALLMPASVLAAMGLDGVLTASVARGKAAALAALPLAVALLAVPWGEVPLDGSRLAAGLAFGLGAVLFAGFGWRWLLVLLVAGSVFHYGTVYVFSRPREQVKLESPLVSRVRELTPPGGRFAWVGRHPASLLSPNQEELLGLASVHYHTCFPSEPLARWADGLDAAGPARPEAVAEPDYSRRFLALADEGQLTREVLATSGIALLLSMHPLDESVAVVADRVGDVFLSRPRLAAPREAQLLRWERGERGPTVRADGILDTQLAVVRQPTGAADRLRFDVTPVQDESLLFVSQEHHPAWKAAAGGRPLPTVAVNGLFLGVLLAPGTAEVELRCEPFVRWSLLPQVLFVLAALGVLASRRRRAAAGS